MFPGIYVIKILVRIVRMYDLVHNVSLLAWVIGSNEVEVVYFVISQFIKGYALFQTLASLELFFVVCIRHKFKLADLTYH